MSMQKMKMIEWLKKEIADYEFIESTTENEEIKSKVQTCITLLYEILAVTEKL